MFAHLLIAYDGSELAEKALDLSLQLAGKHGSAVTILASTEPIETGLGTGSFGAFDTKSINEKLEIGYSAAATGTLEAAENKAATTGITAESL